MATLTTAETSARDTFATLLTMGADVQNAATTLTRAEKFGYARLGSATILHTGYVPGAKRFAAETSLFTIVK